LGATALPDRRQIRDQSFENVVRMIYWQGVVSRARNEMGIAMGQSFRDPSAVLYRYRPVLSTVPQDESPYSAKANRRPSGTWMESTFPRLMAS